MKRIILGIAALLAVHAAQAELKKDSINYIDEVVWVVGDEPILRSDIEVARIQAEQEGVKWAGDPDCRIPEQIAVQKLFLNQAALDSIEVTEAEISQGVDQQINAWVQMIGSQEKLEQSLGKSIKQQRDELRGDISDLKSAYRILADNFRKTQLDLSNTKTELSALREKVAQARRYLAG